MRESRRIGRIWRLTFDFGEGGPVVDAELLHERIAGRSEALVQVRRLALRVPAARWRQRVTARAGHEKKILETSFRHFFQPAPSMPWLEPGGQAALPANIVQST